MSNFPSKQHLSVADVAEEQNPIWCSSGIDLFVDIRIDSSESTQELCSPSCSIWEAPGRRGDVLQAQGTVSPPAGPSPHSSRTLDIREEKPYVISMKEAGREHLLGELSGTDVASRDLRDDRFLLIEDSPRLARSRRSWNDGPEEQYLTEEAPSVSEVAARKLDNAFVWPLVVQLGEQPWSKLPVKNERDWSERLADQFRRDDHEDRRHPNGCPRQCKTGCISPSRRQQEGKCHHILQEENGDDLHHVGNWEEGFRADQLCNDQFGRDDEPYICNENRSWSPVSEEYSWTPMIIDTCTDPQDQSTQVRLDTTATGVHDAYEQGCGNLPSFTPSEAVQVMELGCDAGPNFQMSRSPVTSPDIESFNVAEIAAACQLLEMSCCKYRKEFRDQELAVPKQCDAYTLGIRGDSNLEGLAQMVDKIHSVLPATNARSPVAHAVQHTKVEESNYGSDDSDSSRSRIGNANYAARRTKSANRARLRRYEIGDSSDSEILDRPPRKRQYKSMQELLKA